jgi:septal ring factor EnvC (AmiA/AmiB activator)
MQFGPRGGRRGDMEEDSVSEKHSEDTPQATPAPELDRIRDIIFGPQMRDYQQRFQAFQRDLDRLQKQMNQLSEELTKQDQSQGEKLQALRREAQQAGDDLRGELRQTAQELTASKVDRVTLGELFVEIGSCLKTGGSVAEVLQNLVLSEQGPECDGS